MKVSQYEARQYSPTSRGLMELSVGEKNPILICVPLEIFNSFKEITDEISFFISILTLPIDFADPDGYQLQPDAHKIPMIGDRYWGLSMTSCIMGTKYGYTSYWRSTLHRMGSAFLLLFHIDLIPKRLMSSSLKPNILKAVSLVRNSGEQTVVNDL
jgi:hypothetical protein